MMNIKHFESSIILIYYNVLRSQLQFDTFMFSSSNLRCAQISFLFQVLSTHAGVHWKVEMAV